MTESDLKIALAKLLEHARDLLHEYVQNIEIEGDSYLEFQRLLIEATQLLSEKKYHVSLDVIKQKIEKIENHFFLKENAHLIVEKMKNALAASNKLLFLFLNKHNPDYNDVLLKKGSPFLKELKKEENSKEKNYSIIKFLEKNPEEYLKKEFFPFLKQVKANTELKLTEKNRFNHQTSEANKLPKGKENSTRDKDTWFFKIENDPYLLTLEVIAGELFRLFTGTHPKTRYGINEKGETGILSKGVPEFRPLNTIESAEVKQKIEAGHFHGLGAVLILALVFNEADLKRGNIGIDSKGRFIKIDGDHTFSHLLHLRGQSEKRNAHFTHEDLQKLPFLKTYQPYNWLDIFYEGTASDKSVFSNTPSLRKEINKTALKMCVFPALLIKQFVSHYTLHKDYAKKISQEIIDRINKLLIPALSQDESFKTYLLSNEAEEDLQRFTAELNDFKSVSKKYPFREVNNTDTLVKEAFEQLKATFPSTKNVKPQEEKAAAPPLKTEAEALHSMLAQSLTRLQHKPHALFQPSSAAVTGKALPAKALPAKAAPPGTTLT